jgi:hypothetical protein
MAFPLAALAPGLLDGALKLIDRLFPDPQAAADAKRKLLEQEGQQALAELQHSMAAILAEAKSADPWTSRARPSFLYVVYLFILAAIPMGVVYAFAPETADRISTGATLWLAAIPEEMWWLFGTGYLGYTGFRSIDKMRAK